MRNEFYSDFDRERRFEHRRAPDEYRGEFQRDRDGVIYSSAFRRLQAKTQVFLSGQYDFYRTRLTHSIEVAQIGRSICNRLEAGDGGLLGPGFTIDRDLVEAVCLTHDLGHPPFGHAGERTLHRLMRGRFGGFEGNAQSLRIITETIYADRDGRKGLNPTRAFVDGILKYPRLWSENPAADNHFLYDGQAEWLDFARPPGDNPANGPPSIECEIMDWADDTAYSINDIADGVNAGFLDPTRIEAWAADQSPTDHLAARLVKLLDAIRRRAIDAWAGKRVGEFIKACSLAERDETRPGASNRHRLALTIAPAVRAEARLYKKLSVDLVFRSANIRQLEYKGDHILERIFQALEQAYLSEEHGLVEGLLPDAFHRRLRAEPSVPRRARLLCDYLAGMTDGFATRTYKRLFDPDFGLISELM